MPKITEKDVQVPADVPDSLRAEYVKNYLAATRHTGRLMLFAGDQKIEHLNDDYYGTSKLGPIHEDDNVPEHLFKVASTATIGIFATQHGMIARYGPHYPKVNYLVKMNSKTHLVKTTQKDPLSLSLVDFEDVLVLKKSSKLNIVGIGYTIYLGSEFEHLMLAEAGKLVTKAHQHGMITVLWIYPRGKAVADETDAHLIAGATGTGAALGTDFVKVNYPKKEGSSSAEIFKEAIKSAGRLTKVVCAGGSSTDTKKFLEGLHEQIHTSGAAGNATGRNAHQKSFADAVRMCNAIASIVLGDKDVSFAVQVAEGKAEFTL